MPLLNSRNGYGALTKTLHWGIALLFALQYLGAWIMMRTPADGATLGIGQAAYYNWHKSLGLLALALAVIRIVNRSKGELPPWAPSLSPLEHKLIHRAERLLYMAMLAMPLSGFLYCMAGGYGVLLFGALEIPNPIGALPWLAGLSRGVHVAAAFLLLLPLGFHLGIVLGHHVYGRDRLLDRMLPGRRDT